MPGNSFGKIFKITTFGESHGPLVGVVIDGVPAGLPLSTDDIDFELQFRRPGKIYTSPRSEEDKVEIVSGLFNGKTTGAPLTMIIRNKDIDSSYYEEIRYTPRPNHADIPYIIRYGYENWDYRGGGRASGRETVSRVAAGAVAKKLLMLTNTLILGYIKSIGSISCDCNSLEELTYAKCSPVRTCKPDIEQKFVELLSKAISEGDSYGGVAEVHIFNPPPGLGEPVFDKIKADLAKAVMSIPGVVGFEYGLGFDMAKKKGSEVLDEVFVEEGRVRWRYNYAGGILGGVTTGEKIIIRCAFKPTTSITSVPQKTIDVRTFESKIITVKGRHDPCIAIRGVPVVEAMTAIVMVDHAIRSNVISSVKLSNKEVEVIQSRWERYRSLCRPSEEYR